MQHNRWINECIRKIIIDWVIYLLFLFHALLPSAVVFLFSDLIAARFFCLEYVIIHCSAKCRLIAFKDRNDDDRKMSNNYSECSLSALQLSFITAYNGFKHDSLMADVTIKKWVEEVGQHFCWFLYQVIFCILIKQTGM